MNNEFQAYLDQLTGSGAVSLGKTASELTPEKTATASTAIGQSSVPSQDVPMGAKIASLVADAEANLPRDLQQYADSLAFMEAFNANKEASLYNNNVQEANSMNYNNPALNPQYNPVLNVGAQAYAPQYAQQKYASDAQEANVLYNEAYQEQEQLLKTASEAQSFVDAIYAKHFRNHLEGEAQVWNAYANQAYAPNYNY